MSKPEHYSVIIIGAGMIGLTLAALLARANFSVAIVEANKPSWHFEREKYDARVSAINWPTFRILQNLSVISALPPSSINAFRHIHVWDFLGGASIDFDSADIGIAQLGLIVENREIMQVLGEQLQNKNNVTFYCPEQPQQVIKQSQQIQLVCANKNLTAQLIVGADGGESWLRKHMSLATRERPYEQAALFTVVKSEKPHQQTAYQNFLPTGPLGFLPLADPHHGAIVWSANIEYAESLMNMSLKEFNRELTNALAVKIGEMQLLNERRKISLVMRHARHYVMERIALIGDAVHTIHPLAGQGANLGFLDAACLAQCLMEAQQKGQDIGELRPLRRYERWRKGDNSYMLAMMSGFKELFAARCLPIVQLRNNGLKIVNHMQFIKNYFMRYAMGEHEDLPDIARKN